jgi:transcriptional regulator with XRE-family HTH domain
MDKLQRWILAQLNRRNETPRSASRAAGLDHAAISRYLAGTRPSIQSCQKLAAHFEAPASYVLYLAGHLEAPPEMEPFLAQIGSLSGELTEDQKRALVDVARSMTKRS